MNGDHFIKSWSTTQKNVTLSSGESELVAAVKANAELIGALQMGADWGFHQEGEVYVDSSAALGVIKRTGCGRMRHIKVGQLWIQEREEEGDLRFHKVHGESNIADLLTKHLREEKILRFMQQIGFEERKGRAKESLGVA